MWIRISWRRDTGKYVIRINDREDTTVTVEYVRCKNALKYIDKWLFCGAQLFDKIDRQYYKEMKEWGHIKQ